MKILAQCPNCGQQYHIEQSASDKMFTCSSCRKAFRIPKLDEAVSKAQSVSGNNVVIDQDGNFYA